MGSLLDMEITIHFSYGEYRFRRYLAGCRVQICCWVSEIGYRVAAHVHSGPLPSLVTIAQQALARVSGAMVAAAAASLFSYQESRRPVAFTS